MQVKVEAPQAVDQQSNASVFEPVPLQRVMITAGGTGGHIFPGIAVAQLLLQKSVSVRWVGTDYGLEKDIVPKANIPLHFLPVKALRGKGFIRAVTFPWMIARSVWQGVQLIRKTQPQVVLSLGGYASGPLAIAAWLCRVPLAIHEQNAAPGLTNRLLAPIASLILSGLPNKFERYPHYREIGNPVRDAFLAVHKRRRQEQLTQVGELKLLVVGGSQGAMKLNKAVPKALAQILSEHAELKVRVVHQCGTAHLESTKQAYEELDARVDVVTFIDDIAGAYEWADLVVGRAGALTVAEVAATGVACIFIPLAIAMDDHQAMNAKTLANIGGAAIVTEAQLEAGELELSLSKLMLEPEIRQDMANKALSQAKVNAAQDIIYLLEKLIPLPLSTSSS